MSKNIVNTKSPIDAVFGEFEKRSENELVFYCRDVIQAKKKLINFLLECKNSRNTFQMISALLIKKLELQNNCVDEDIIDKYTSLIENDEYYFQLDEFLLFAHAIKCTIIINQKNGSPIIYNEKKEEKIYIFFNGFEYYRLFPAKYFNPLDSFDYLQIVFMDEIYFVHYPFKQFKATLEIYEKKLQDFDESMLNLKNIFALSDDQISDLINQNEKELDKSLKNLIQEIGVFLMKDDPNTLEKTKAQDGLKVFFIKNKTTGKYEIGFSNEGNYLQIKLKISKLTKEVDEIYKNSFSNICSENFMNTLIQNDLFYEPKPLNKLVNCGGGKIKLGTVTSGLINQLMNTKTKCQLVLDSFQESFLSLNRIRSEL